MWNSSSFVQTIFVGVVCFCGPGLFNAVTATGSLGFDSPRLPNYSNTLLYFSFAIYGFFCGSIYNTLGNRLLCALSAGTYCIYMLFHTVAEFASPGTYVWARSLAVGSGLLLGAGTCCLWTSQAASLVAFSTPGTEQWYTSIFWIIFSMGGCFGGLLIFFLNFSREFQQLVPSPSAASGMVDDELFVESRISYLTAYTIVVLMALGVVIAITLLKPTQEVVKANGIHAVPAISKNFGQEFAAFYAGLKNPRAHLMLLFFFTSNIWYPYFFNGINRGLLNPRSRGLVCACFWLVQLFAAQGGMNVLSGKHYNRRGIALRFFWLLVGVSCLAFGFGFYLQFYYRNGWSEALPPFLRDDIIQQFSSTWIVALVLILYGIMDALIQTFNMWVTSISAGSISQIAQLSSVAKFVQAVGAGISWWIDAAGFDYQFQFTMCWILFLLSLPPALVLCYSLPDTAPFPVVPPHSATGNEVRVLLGTQGGRRATKSYGKSKDEYSRQVHCRE